MRFQILAVLITSGSFAAAQRPSSAGGSPEHHSDLEITWHILKPAELPAPDVSQLHVPAGFRLQKFAENVGNARILAIGPNGNVYVTRREEGDVLMFRVGADGLAAGEPVRVASRSGLHGIAFSKGKVYLAAVHEIFKADVRPDGTFGPLDMIIHDLPDAGQHNTRTVQIGPDDMMYISIGSTCNECAEPNPENATILRASLDGKSRSIFASGLRDTVGWGWQPQTGELWGMDNGMDALGDNLQPEELNHIEKGKRYGWPYLFGDNQPNPHLDPPGGIQKSELAKTNVPMVLGYTAHAAPMQMSFYNASQFPAEYQGDAFVSMRGSWNRKPPSGLRSRSHPFQERTTCFDRTFCNGFCNASGRIRETGRQRGRTGRLPAFHGRPQWRDLPRELCRERRSFADSNHLRRIDASSGARGSEVGSGHESPGDHNKPSRDGVFSPRSRKAARFRPSILPTIRTLVRRFAGRKDPAVRNLTRSWPKTPTPGRRRCPSFIGSCGTFPAT